MRFNEILKNVNEKGPMKWTDIAYQFGYSDQSHFIKEFKNFSGFSPEAFIKLELEEGQEHFVPINKDKLDKDKLDKDKLDKESLDKESLDKEG